MPSADHTGIRFRAASPVRRRIPDQAWVNGRRVHPAYLWGGALLLVSVPLRLIISETAAWRAFAEFLVR